MEDDVTRNIEEQLSAFLDGELPEEELQLLVRRLEKEPSYRATLARYSLAGSLLRNDAVLPSMGGFRESVTDVVAAESVSTGAGGPQAAVVAAAPAGWSPQRLSLAAALLVGIAVVGVSQWLPVTATPQVAATFDTDTSAPLVNIPAAEQLRPVRQARRSSIKRDRLTSYMVSHGEFSRSFHGTMVDSRIFVQQASFED